MLYQRYGNPMNLLQQMLAVGQFSEFISEVIRIRNNEEDEKYMWEYYLHRVFDKSFKEFMNDAKTVPDPEASKGELETTIRDNFEMMENFHPE